MSSAQIAVRTFRKLESEDISVLQVIEQHMKNYKYVPKNVLQNQAIISFSEFEFRLPILIKMGFVRGWREKYIGYKLTAAGYDVLALNSIVKADVIEAFGKQLGIGKESDVYDSLTSSGKKLVLKFHRVGRTSFKKTKLKRNYTIKYSYTPNWHHQSRIAAKKEYIALKLLFQNGIAVPKPIIQTHHVLVMSMIDGVELYHFSELPNPQKMYNLILDNIKKMYQNVKIIHGDLSPYNIIVQRDFNFLIIDWPQNVSRSHPNSEVLLERDVKNVLSFFKRKYGLKNNLKTDLEFITEKFKN
jgi:RIO kinase 2